ncbi:MAG: hypothetical protein DMG68_11110 [Acidobacteria bacterium]|nr:MAG: hypothetical protein DMG68_11110 [Acidobacteriota bacterium]
MCQKVEEQDSGNLTLNHSTVDLRSTNHRFGLTRNHDSSMRTLLRWASRTSINHSAIKVSTLPAIKFKVAHYLFACGIWPNCRKSGKI